MPARRSTRIQPTRGKYRPSADGEQLGYTPAYRTRKAPKAYWRRKPEGYGTPGPRVRVEEEPFYFPWEE